MRSGVCILAAMLIFSFLVDSLRAESAKDAPTVVVAQPAPTFVLKDLSGHEIHSSDFSQATLIVCFWVPGDIPSQRQLTALKTIRSKGGTNHIEVIGISLHNDDGFRARRYVQAQELLFPVVRYNDEVVQGFGGITAVPTTFIVDRHRNIISKHVGYVEANILEMAVTPTLRQYHEIAP